MRKYAIPVVFSLFISLFGCATPERNCRTLDNSITPIGYSIADNLVNNLSQKINSNDQIIVSSFVNVNNLEQSSTFGRIIAEQVASRLSQNGYKIIELKLRQNSIFIQEGKGEFMLSRNLKDLSRTYNASAIVVGTYGDGYDRIYVTSRIVNPNDNTIIASADGQFPMHPNRMNVLLRSK